jgi:hypothetical protein
MARPSIAIVSTYFGKTAPFWLPAFLVSCRANADVQWLLYTDFEVASPPPNVAIRPLEVSDFNQRASDALHTRIDISRWVRKACDLKPAYGVIFEDDLRRFDFWAHSDIDIVWGDVRRFVTDELLERYDVVSSRSHRLSGHFTLYRNTLPTTRLFELIPDVAMHMGTRRYMYLDETHLTHHLQEHMAGDPAPSWPRVYWPSELTTSAKYQRSLGQADVDRLWWRQGRTFDAAGQELMYLHFHKMKQDMTTINFGPDDRPAAFAIDRKGFWA